MGEIQRRRGFLERAQQTFDEGRTQAHLLHDTRLESRALLGIGDVLHQQGQIVQAKAAYEDAETRVTSGFGSATVVAEAEVRLARVAILQVT